MKQKNLSKRIIEALDRANKKLEQAQRKKNEPIAIIGASCRFPGANSCEEFWELLTAGRDEISQVPPERWDINEFYNSDPEASGKMYCRDGGFIKNADLFDASFFGISPREAESMDPQQRLLLKVTWEALERAGINPLSLTETQSGVYIASTTHEYSKLLIDEEKNTPLDTYYASGNAPNALPGRLSYFLGLHGSCMNIDTACSSSLVAIHLACQSLRNGENDFAIAGGINLILSPELTSALCRARMLSPSGRCKTFSSEADGYVRSEGCAVLLLKRHSDALRDCDPILALIQGSSVNQDGASGGFTVPHGPSQQALIQRALKNAGLEAKDIDYLEAHGTGTPLGDPIEIQAAAAVLGKGRTDNQPLLIGSVKTNIGHLEAASGMAGILKTIAALQNEQIPPHLHFRHPSPEIPWSELCVKVTTELTDWKRGERPRYAGVNSFGASGTNAHIILGESPQEESSSIIESEQLFTLSAKTASSLRKSIENYIRFLDTHPNICLRDLCFTNLIGRADFQHRLALVSSSPLALKNQLSSFLANEKESIDDTEEHQSPLKKAAQAYLKGKPLDPAALYHQNDPKPKRIILPTYSFEEQSYWIKSKIKPAPIFQNTWKKADPSPPLSDRTKEIRHWIVLSENEKLEDGISKEIEKRSLSVTLISDRDQRTEKLQQRLSEIPERQAAGLLFFPHSNDPIKECHSVLKILQCMTEQENRIQPRLWIITSSTQSIHPSDQVLNPNQAPLWGLAKVIGTEHPKLWGGLIDMEPEPTHEGLACLFQTFPMEEEQIAIRNNEIFVSRLNEFSSPHPRDSHPVFKGSCLITGGLGALGLSLASWAANHGAEKLILISRKGETESTREKIKALRDQGTEVWTPQADISVFSELEPIFEGIKSEGPPIHSIFHLAGILQDGMTLDMDEKSLAKVFAPKITGALNLHRLSQDMPIDFFVMFSSIAPLFGAPGQGNYAAANAFLDAFAFYRHGLGQPALSINWGPWAQEGMAADLDNLSLDRLSRLGISSLKTKEALASMEQFLGDKTLSQICVAKIGWEKLIPQIIPKQRQKYLSPFKKTEEVKKESAKGLNFDRQWEHCGRDEREKLLIQILQDIIVRILHLPQSRKPDKDTGLDTFGMDSLTSTELKNNITAQMNIDIPVQNLMGGVTISGIAKLIEEQFILNKLTSEQKNADEKELIEVLI